MAVWWSGLAEAVSVVGAVGCNCALSVGGQVVGVALMATCENCGAGFGPVRRDARYCSARCRQAARRRRLRAEAEARRYTLTLESRALVDRLAAVLPKTAAGVERFVQVNGADCAEAAVKLVLTAYAEAVAERV